MNYSDFVLFCKENPPAVKKQWVDSFSEMILHTRKNKESLKKVIDRLRPNEPEELKEYRVENIEYITHGSINDAIQRSKKILEKSNYTYTISDDLEKKLKDPIYEFDAVGTPDYSRFNEVIYNRVFPLMADTGNGAVVWLPINPEDKKEPPNKMAQSMDMSFAFALVQPKDIFYISNYSLLWKLKNTVKVKKGDVETVESVYFFCDNDRYIKLMPKYVQQGDSLKLVYDEILWYSMVTKEDTSNKFKYPPFILTKGNAMYDEDGNLYYDSFFGGFVPWGNLAYKAFTDYDAVRTLNSFPIREEKESDCDVCSGKGKVLNSEKKLVNCGKCKGTGNVIAKNPFSVHKIKKPSRIGGEDKSDWHNTPAVRWLTPPVDILDHAGKTWKEFLEMGEQQINIKFLDEAQSGVAKNIDREGLTDMLMAIAQNVGNILEKSLTVLEGLTHASASTRVDVKVKMPTHDDLQVKSGTQLLNEYKEMSAAPVFIRNRKVMELVDKIYPDDPDMKKYTKVLAYFDPLFGKTDDEISKLTPMSLYKNQIVKHELGTNALTRIMENDYKFFRDSSIQDISKQLLEDLQPELNTEVKVEDPFSDEL